MVGPRGPPPDRVEIAGHPAFRIVLGGADADDAREPAMKIPVLLFLLAGMAVARAAPAFLNRVWQTSEGMPSNVVSDVAQDADGYLWLATGSGVARFDGLRFDVERAERGLPDNQVICLVVDRGDRVWAGTRRGLAWRDDRGNWRTVEEGPGEAVWALHESEDGAVWAGTERGPWRVSREGRAERIDLGEATPDVRAFADDGEGGMWVLTRVELLRRAADETVAREEGPWRGHELWGLSRDASGRLLLSGEGVLLRGGPGGWEDLSAGIPEAEESVNVRCSEGPDGVLWVSTRNRGLLFREGGRWAVWDTNSGLSLDDSRALWIGRDGLVWAGTNGGGLNRLRRRPFDVFGASEGLGRTVASAVAEDAGGTVWVGTDGSGLFRFDGEGFVPAFTGRLVPPDGFVWSLQAARDGALWIGTFRDGLFRWKDGVLGKPEGDLPENWIPALHEARDGSLLVGMRWSGLARVAGGRVFRDPDGPHAGGLSLTDVLEDREGGIWVASSGEGLVRWKEGRWDWLSVGRELPGPALNVLHESPDGDLWIGTSGMGLVRHRDGNFVGWRKADGLLSDTVVQIVEDGEGFLWLGTDAGLQRVSPGELERQRVSGGTVSGLRLSREDGLPTPQFSAEHGNLSLRARDGSLWFCLAAGVVRVDPDRLPAAPPPPVVRIEAVETDAGPLSPDRPAEGIPPGSGPLRIRFSSPGFVAPARLPFRHRLVGLEDEWRDAEGARVVSYPSLPPGDYRFEVMAANHDGVWSAAPAAVEVRILPYYWQTPLFRAAVALASLGLCAWGVRRWSLRRIRRKVVRLQQERRVEMERARIARDLHDELGASLTEINFLGTLAGGSLPEGGAREKVAGIVERARRMAKSLDEIVWTVNPANDTLASTAHYLCSRAGESLAAAGLRCRFEVADDLPGVMLDSERRHHLLMAVNEAVNNAMKHAGASALHLAVGCGGDGVVVRIRDDGRGFDPAAVPEDRNGLRNLRRRMEAVGGRCEISSVPGTGTTVTLVVPLP